MSLHLFELYGELDPAISFGDSLSRNISVFLNKFEYLLIENSLYKGVVVSHVINFYPFGGILLILYYIFECNIQHAIFSTLLGTTGSCNFYQNSIFLIKMKI